MGNFNEMIASVKKVWPAQLVRDGVINARLIILGLLGVFLLLAGGLIQVPTTKSKVENTPAIPYQSGNNRSYEEQLEAKMGNLLSQVKGAGSVAVSITLDDNGTYEHDKNVVKESKTVQEKDTNGAVRTTTETKESEQVLMSRENGVDRPVTVREDKPVIKGILVIAAGAYDSKVKADLMEAVEAGLGIPAYKITVLPQRR
ncbi:Hypothetical protein LUCI_3281 [Lucifera butyrica]|uniref:Stage III sporulation protein AG n=1 Tax=Lucifera butyrica TaxID=1351585 RepID=A0A498R5M5_9FIRM|nr:hypothetical protein [Lucifera butyrica]VBB08016.1 Hypothetical protein LUCI_3281 [Lucifera butyrica]